LHTLAKKSVLQKVNEVLEMEQDKNAVVPNQPENEPNTNSTHAKNKGGAPKGNSNATKLGKDLKYQSYMSKITRGFFEEFFELKFGRKPHNETELIQLARQIAENAIRAEMVQEFERQQPGRITSSSGEVF
jgi:hypothetical protein